MVKWKKINWPVVIVIILLVGLVLGAVIVQVKERNMQDDPMLEDIKNAIRPLFKSDDYYSGALAPLNDRDLMNEVTFLKSKSGSYNINKSRIYLCLKDEEGNYYDKQTLIYVTLHECAHSLCDEIGHTDKFHDIFEALLDLAAKKGVYDSSHVVPTDYCSWASDDDS